MCGHRLGETPAATLPTSDDLGPDERARWLAALDAERGIAVRVVSSYLVLGWAGLHRFAAGDEIGGVLRLLAAAFAAAAAFGLNVNDPGHVIVPAIALGALWAVDAPFIPRLLHSHRERAERRFFVETWRARQRGGHRASPPRG